MAKKNSKNKPIIKSTFNNIVGAVFEKKTDDGVFYSVSIQKYYKNDDGEWDYTTNFNEKELLIVSQMASYLYLKIQELKDDDN